MTEVYPEPRGAVTFYLDFGRELVGWLEVDLDAPAGTVVDFNCFEEIVEGERIQLTNGNKAAWRVITREGRQRHVSFLRRGVRYIKVMIRGHVAPVRLRAVRVIHSVYPSPRRGAFACSDYLLNRIWEVSRQTLECCSEDTYTDCPAFEQTYWVGDARNEALINHAAYGDLALNRRCVDLAAQSLERSPLVECVGAAGMIALLPAWSFLWVQMAEELWQFSGDKAWLEQIYPKVRDMLRTCREKYTDERGLFTIEAWNLLDWADIDYLHKTVTHNQMLLAESWRRAATLARALGKWDDAHSFDEERQTLIDIINNLLWDEKKQAYLDSIHEDGTFSPKACQHNSALAILYDIAPGERKAKLRGDLMKPRNKTMAEAGSPFALFFFLEALAAEGRQREMVNLMRTKWDIMLSKGATTFWETFTSLDPQWWTRSYCHAWSAGPLYFLSRYQLGAWWAEPGYKRALIQPHPADLKWARGRVPTPEGEIEIEWKLQPRSFDMKIALPAATAATVILPIDPAKFKRVEAGPYEAKIEEGLWRIELPAGVKVKIKAGKG